MRFTLTTVCLLLALSGGAWAREQSRLPTEQAAFAATENLFRAVAARSEAARRDVLLRFLDADAALRRAFGKAGAPKRRQDRSALREAIRGHFAIVLFDRMPRPTKPLDGALTSTGASTGARLVSWREGANEVVFAWATDADGVTRLVDMGNDTGLMCDGLAGMWKLRHNRETALAMLASLLAEMQEDDKAKDPKNELGRAMDRVRSLVTLMVARRDVERWPRVGGKNFVLSLVASGSLDVRKDSSRRALFSPRVPTANIPAAWAYANVDWPSLQRWRNYGHLTSYAGRRNDERPYTITSSEEKKGAILLADLSYKGKVIAGYSNGSVRVLTPADLGLLDTEPIEVGDAARNPELRKLSLK